MSSSENRRLAVAWAKKQGYEVPPQSFVITLFLPCALTGLFIYLGGLLLALPWMLVVFYWGSKNQSKTTQLVEKWIDAGKPE